MWHGHEVLAQWGRLINLISLIVYVYVVFNGLSVRMKVYERCELFIECEMQRHDMIPFEMFYSLVSGTPRISCVLIK